MFNQFCPIKHIGFKLNFELVPFVLTVENYLFFVAIAVVFDHFPNWPNAHTLQMKSNARENERERAEDYVHKICSGKF